MREDEAHQKHSRGEGRENLTMRRRRRRRRPHKYPLGSENYEPSSERNDKPDHSVNASGAVEQLKSRASVCPVSKTEIGPLEKPHQKVGGTRGGSPRRKLREAELMASKEEKGKRFNKNGLVSRVKRRLNVNLGDKEK